MSDVVIRIKIQDGEAKATLEGTNKAAKQTKQGIEKPASININTAGAIANLRDVMLNFSMVGNAIKSVTNQINGYLDASLKQKQAAILTKNAFGSQAKEIMALASNIQSLTNTGDEELLPLMAKLRQTYKLTTEDVKALSPVLVDFADANAATGMTVATAFDLMGRAVNGHTEMLGRYGIELDKTRLKEEGVAYLVQTLTETYGGTSASLADLRLQNKNTWGDIKETLGDMITVIITPLLKGLKSLMEWYQKLTPATKGWVTGLAAAIPVIATVTTVTTVLITAITALKAVISPVTLIISGIAAALAIAGGSYAAYKLSVDAAAAAQKGYNNELNGTLEKINSLIEYQRQYAGNLGMDAARAELDATGKAIDDLLAKYQTSRAELQPGKLINTQFSKEDENRLRELLIQEGALKERINDATAAAAQYAAEMERINQETSLKGIELIEYQLAQEKEYYNTLADLTEEDHKKKLESYKKIRELENQLAASREQQTAQAQQLIYEQMSAEDQLLANKKKKLQLIDDLEAESALSSEEATAARLGAEEQYNQAVIALKKTELEAEINVLSQKKELGVATWEEILAALQRYADWAKEIYGSDSAEYAAALGNMQLANLQYSENKRATWEKNHQLEMRMISDTAGLYRSTLQTIVDEHSTAAEKMAAISDAIKQRIINGIIDMSAEYIEKKLIEMAMAVTAEKTKQAAMAETAAVEKGINAASVIGYLATSMVKVGIAIKEIAAKIFAFYASLGPFAIPAGLGTIGAIVALIKGFASGGYTGDGAADEPAGIVHKKEMIFEAGITQPNLSGLLGLRKLLQKGYKIQDLFGGISLPAVTLPQPQMAYQTGGYSGNVSLADDKLLSQMINKLDEVKRAIVMNDRVRIDGNLNLIDKRSGADRYNAVLEDQVKYNRSKK